jgi:hypothetical protein
MAKKVVATLKVEGGRTLTKVIKCEKSKKTGAYTFKETILPTEEVKDFIAKN